MNDLVAESCRHAERSAVNDSAWSGSYESAGVANIATDTVEKRVASNGGRGDWVLTTRSACCSHEVGESQHVVAIILRILDRIERRRERHVDHTFSRAGRVLVGSSISSSRTSAAEAVERVRD